MVRPYYPEEVEVMGLRKLWNRMVVRTGSVDELVELLPTISESISLGDDSDSKFILEVDRRFTKLPTEVRREALIKGLAHSKERVRLACAERLGDWMNSPRVSVAMLKYLDVGKDSGKKPTQG